MPDKHGIIIFKSRQLEQIVILARSIRIFSNTEHTTASLGICTLNSTRALCLSFLIYVIGIIVVYFHSAFVRTK